jgi:Na+-driven multidrug efflux pump
MQTTSSCFALIAAVTTGTCRRRARGGAGRWHEAARHRASIALAAAFGALGMLASRSRDAVALLGVEGEVADLGGACLAALLCFNVPFAIELALSMALRGAGDVRTPLWVGIFANAINVVLCYALVFGRLGAPELGAIGSAIAGGVAFSASALLLVALWWCGCCAAASHPGASLTRAMSWRCCASASHRRLQLAFQSWGVPGLIALYGTPAAPPT